VFQQYPQIEPLRYSIFKKMLVGRDSLGYVDHLKHWVRPLWRQKRTAGPLEKVDVVVFVEGNRDVIVNALLPVHRQLLTRGIKTRLISFHGPTDLADALEFEFAGAALAPSWASSSWESLCSAVEELRDKSLRKVFNYSCAITKALLDECERVLDQLQPRIVLTASNPLEGGVAMGISTRARGALALLLQHGILQPFYTPVIADYMLTWGSSSTETLARFGVERRQLPALGSPRHDAMVQSTDGSARRRFLKAIGLPDRPTFCFFSNGNDLVRNGTAPIECAEWLQSIASRFESALNVVVRLHPNEDGRLFKECSNVRVIKQAPDLATTLDGCDWVGSLCSTVLYDALLFGKPVWQFYADGWPDLADNWKHGLARRIASREELTDATGRMIEHCEPVDSDLCERVFANHGKAAQVVADYVQGRL
jgi:hypothetical protein